MLCDEPMILHLFARFVPFVSSVRSIDDEDESTKIEHENTYYHPPKKDKSKANFTIVLHSLKKRVYLGESVRVSEYVGIYGRRNQQTNK